MTRTALIGIEARSQAIVAGWAVRDRLYVLEALLTIVEKGGKSVRVIRGIDDGGARAPVGALDSRVGLGKTK
jgi:hypothetical protein